MDAEPRHLVVGRLRKPHGLKGECTVFPLTSDPNAVFAPGRSLRWMGVSGTVLGEPAVIERSRAYHREWLVKFRAIDSRDELEAWKGQFLAAPAEELPLPKDGEVYLHELEGFAVRRTDGTALGVVTSLFEMPMGLMLEVQGPKREFLLPFKQQFVRETRRDERVLVVEVPEGLIE